MKIGILFDLDGTLLDTLQDLTDSVNYALAQFGCPPRTPADVRSFLGNGAKQLIALSLPEENAPDVDQVLAVYKKYYKDHCQIKTAPYAGIPEALETLKEKYAIAVVSNKPDIGVDKIVYIGDSEVDVLTANRAGAPCIAVSWGFRDREDLVDGGAVYICDDPATLPEMIETIVGEVHGK